MSDLHATVTQNILQIRHARRWTAQTLAHRCPGLSRATISKIENGHRHITLHDLEVLAPALGVEPWQLLRPLTVDVIIKATKEDR